MPGRWWKLPVTFLLLVAIGCVSVRALLVTLSQHAQMAFPLLPMDVNPVWVAAVAGGILGGIARALYSFLFENWAFHYRQTTGKTSPCIQRVWDTEDIEDDMDPLVCWHLYLIKPVAGATLGSLFAVGAELGLGGVGTLGGVEPGAVTKAMLRAAVAAGLAGLFMENVMHGLRRYTESSLRRPTNTPRS